MRTNRSGRPLVSWNHVFGAISLSSLTAGALWAYAAEGAAIGLAQVQNAWVPFPAQRGVLRHLAVRLRTAALGVNTTWTVHVAGAPTSLSVTLPAGQAAVAFSTDVEVPLVGTGNVVSVQFTAASDPGAGNVRPIVYVGGYAEA